MMNPHLQSGLAAQHQAGLLRQAEQHMLARQVFRSPGLLRLGWRRLARAALHDAPPRSQATSRIATE
jgi:hypothetical protein